MDTEKSKSKKADRGRDTLFRVAYQHQGKLIQIADYKANMIISISAMVISALIAVIGYGAVANKIEEYGVELVLPLVLIILSSLMSLVFAILASRPKLIRAGKGKDPSQKSSLFFFGVISSYTQSAYIQKMNELVTDDENIYEQLTIDLYNQGLILKRKYNLLLYAYQGLMIGFILSAVIFILFLLMEL